jgi:membrane protease YdiL (CAAX protease family)
MGPAPVSTHERFGAPGQPPSDRPDAWTWLAVAVGGFLLAQVVGAVLISVAAALAGQFSHLSQIEQEAVPPEWFVGVELVGVWTGFLGAPWVASRVRGTGRLLRDMGVRFRAIDLVGIPIGVGAQFLIDGIATLLRSHLHNFGAPVTKLTGGAHGSGFIVIAVMTVLGAPILEELYFRGLLLRALARLFTRNGAGSTRLPGSRPTALAAAVVVDGLLFGLAHWEAQQFAFLAAFGMILAVVAVRTNRLGMNIVAHASFNMVAVVAVLNARGGAIV